FLVLAAALVAVARVRARVLAADKVALETTAQPAGVAGKAGGFIPRVIPWAIDVSEDLAPCLGDDPTKAGVRSRIAALRDLLFAELGLPLPLPRVRVDPELLPKHALLSVYEVPEVTLDLAEDTDPAATIAREVYNLLRARAPEFLGLHETQKLIDE